MRVHVRVSATREEVVSPEANKSVLMTERQTLT